MRNGKRSVILLSSACLLSLGLSDSVNAQSVYDPGDYVFRVSSTQAYDLGTASSDDVGDAIGVEGANALVTGYHAKMAMETVISVQKADLDLKPIRTLLGVVGSDQFLSDGPGAQAAATKAAQQLAAFNAGKDMGAISTFAVNSDPTQDLFKLVSSFYQYKALLDQSVASAQNVETRINQYVSNDVAGKGLLAGAVTFDQRRYVRGQFDCSQLIRQAALFSDLPISQSNTTGWFNKGFGPGWQQIYGGNNGLSVQQLISDLTSGPTPLVLPQGSIIVTDGHAAIYVATVQVSGRPEILLYDANDSDGYITSFDGIYPPGATAPNSIDLPPSLITFPGHTTGLHVTRWQWGHGHLVKIFEPIAEPPGGPPTYGSSFGGPF